jgi:hypothetical protein
MLSLAVVLLAAIFNAASAAGGVVIEQKIALSSQGVPPKVRTRTLMIQGGQEKFELDQHRSVVLDAKSQTATVLNNVRRTFEEMPLNKVTGSPGDPNYSLYSGLTSTGKMRDVLGLRCRDYSGSRHPGSFILATTACLSTDAAGAPEFSEFIKIVGQASSKRSAPSTIPFGVPLLIDSSLSVDPAFGPSELSAREAKRLRTAILKLPPQVMHTVVTRIISQTLPPETFTPPPGYTRRWRH